MPGPLGGVRRRGQWVEPGKPGRKGAIHHYHQYTRNKQKQIPKCVAQGQREHNYGVSGRSLVILRGGYTNLLATLKASNHNSPERRKGMRRNTWHVVRWKERPLESGTAQGVASLAA